MINLLPPLLCALGFAVGLAVVRRTAAAGGSSWSVAFLLGSLFPWTLLPLKPVFAQLGNGLGPALAWCVLGTAVVGGLLRGWERQEVAPR